MEGAYDGLGKVHLLGRRSFGHATDEREGRHVLAQFRQSKRGGRFHCHAVIWWEVLHERETMEVRCVLWFPAGEREGCRIKVSSLQCISPRQFFMSGHEGRWNAP
jgi:hypothetical protein